MKALILAAMTALAAAPAFAHAHLESAVPAVGGTVAPPQEIRLSFSESLEPKFSSVAVSGPGGEVPLEKPALAPGDGRTLVVKFGKPLAPGAYSVKWKATSTDTHRTQGEFGFTVK